MEPFLNGQSAVVTGGSRGIGRAVTQSLLQAGARVVICGRDPAALEETVRELAAHGEVHGQQADTSKPEDVAALFAFAQEKLGSLDILVNNAGVGVFKPTAEITLEEWHRVVDTNLSGVFYCCHHALPLLRERGAGFIVNISSLAAKNPFAGGAAYNASKFGLNGFTEALMLDHRNDNIRVTSIMPGSVDTDFSARRPRAPWKIAPEDIAQIVLDVLRMPRRTLISRVEVRPSRPEKG